PDFDKLITVGGGRGIRFNLLLQDVNQLDEKYGDKLGKVIRSNCETWIYLQSDDEGTLKELSGKLGKYTIKTPSLSGSTGGNLSSSYNLTGRDLLDAAEIKKINRPYQLVTSRNDPAILYAPDVSKTIWNELFGLGSKEHNRKLIIARSSARTERTPDVHYWKIWDLYMKAIQMAQSNEREK
ncbi:MAG: TraG/TraD/VirD4 family protein, partial [Oscillospiraceae bacterium]